MDLKDHELISVLKTLTPEDISSIRTLLNSKFFNNRKIAEKTFEKIIYFYPEFDQKEFTKANIIKSISKEKMYDDSTFRVAISVIFKVTEKYLILKELDEDPFYKDYLLISNHFKNNRLHLIRNNLNSINKILTDPQKKVSEKTKKQFFYATDELNLMLSEGAFNKSFKSNIVFQKYLEVFERFTNYFVHTMTSNYISFDMYSRAKPPNTIKKKVDKLMKDFNFTRILMNINKEDKYYGLTELKINLLNAFSNFKDSKHYFILRENIRKYSLLLSEYDKYIYFGKLVSYCLLKIKEDLDKDFRNEFYNVCKEYAEKKIYKFGPIPLINLTSFKTIFLSAIENDELEWAEYFLYGYYKDTPKEYHKDLINFYSALIDFYKGNYKKILEKLMLVEHDIFLTDLRQLKLLTYYKLNFIVDLKMEIKTFNKYLKSNTSISPYLKKEISRFLKLLDLLNEAGNERKSLTAFERILQNEEYFRFKKTMIHMLKLPGESPRQAIDYSVGSM